MDVLRWPLQSAVSIRDERSFLESIVVAALLQHFGEATQFEIDCGEAVC